MTVSRPGWTSVMELLRTKLVATTVAYGVVEVTARIAQAVAILVLATRFEKRQFGHFYDYLAIYQLVSILSTGGLVEALIGSLSRETDLKGEDLIAEYGRRYIRRSVIVGALCLGSALIVSRIIQIDVAILALLASIVAGMSYGFITVVAAFFTCTSANRRSVTLRVVSAFATFGVGLAFALYSGFILAFFTGLAVSGLLVSGWVAIQIMSGRTRITARAGAGSIWFLIPALLNWFFWYGLVLCVSWEFGPVRAAELAFTNNVANVLFIMNTALSQAWIGRYLADLSEERSSAERTNIFIFRLQSILMIVASLGIILIYEVARRLNVPLVVKYGDLGLEISILLFSISASSTYFSAVNSFAINGGGKQLAILSLLVYVIGGALLLMAGHILGILGIYIGLGALLLWRACWVTRYAIREFSAGFFDVRLIFANAGLLAICALIYLR